MSLRRDDEYQLEEHPDDAPRETPTWIGVAVGILVAAAILVGVMSYLSKRNAAARRMEMAAPVASTVIVQSSAVASVSASAPTAPRPVEKVVVHPIVHPAPSSSVGKTAERAAVDALHSGDPRRAAELYGELATANPDNAAFVEAARLLGWKRPPKAQP